jgi:hypothetical protein
MSLLSLLCRDQSLSGNGYQRRRSLKFLVHGFSLQLPRWTKLPNYRNQVKVILLPTVSGPVCPDVRSQLRPVTNFISSLKCSLDICRFVILWRPLWREDGSVIYSCCLASQAQLFSNLSPSERKTIFYCPNFLDSPNLEGQVPVFISPRESVAQFPGRWVPFKFSQRIAGLLFCGRVAQLYPRALGSLSVAS